MLSLDNSRSTTTSTSSRKRNYCDLATLPPQQKQRGRTNKNKTRGDAAAAAAVSSPVICLTGLTPVEKDQYHALIVKLGGRFTRNLDSSVNTHLISRTAEGAKYQAACDIPHLQIVQPTWLDACAVQQAWIDARPYSLSSLSSHTTTSITTTTTTMHQDKDRKKKHPDEENSLPQPLPMEPLLPQLQQQLAMKRADDCQLFMDCHAFLVGFDKNNDDNVSSSPVVKANLGRLFRRGMGTIHWTVQDNLTHIIVADGLEEKVRDAARLLADQHINFPSIVSPRWIVASWEKNQLLDETKYAPRYKPVRTVVAPQLTSMPGKKPKAAPGRENTLPLRGSLFCFLRISPPETVVDFNRHELLDLVTTAGGQTLTTEMMQALRMDKARSGGGGVALSLRRTCFVVCWGAYQDESNLAMHALLAQMKREELSDIVPVTPLWIQTVVAEQKMIPPTKFAQLFVPPTRPLRKLLPVLVSQTQGKKLHNDNKSMATTPAPLCVCVTGFAGMRRQAIKFALQAMGATYDDSLRPSTTHLICQEAAGSKFEKAQEWNIHTVSIDWLYHVAAYGYHGRSSNNKNGGKEEKEVSRNGCEARFCIRATSTATTSSTTTAASGTCRDKLVVTRT